MLQHSTCMHLLVCKRYKEHNCERGNWWLGSFTVSTESRSSWMKWASNSGLKSQENLALRMVAPAQDRVDARANGLPCKFVPLRAREHRNVKSKFLFQAFNMDASSTPWNTVRQEFHGNLKIDDEMGNCELKFQRRSIWIRASPFPWDPDPIPIRLNYARIAK